MSRIKSLFFVVAIFLITFTSVNVNALNYGSLSSRINQNKSFINSSNSMDSLYRDSFRNKYVTEMDEINLSKGFTAVQQTKIQDLANTILEGDPSKFSDLEKMEKFYNYILDNFYYYNDVCTIKVLSWDRRCDNPYYLLIYEYDVNGKIRARSNGYASMLIALARSQNIPARIIGGYYNKDVRDDYKEWGSNITSAKVNSLWVQAYVNGKWLMFDPVADSYKVYDAVTSEYIDLHVLENNESDNNETSIDLQEENNNSTDDTSNVDEDSNEESNNENNNDNTSSNNENINQNDENNVDTLDNQDENNDDENNTSEEISEPSQEVYQNRFFNPSVEDFSKTHIIFKSYSGTKNLKFISNNNERKNLLAFLNTKSGGVANGKRINSSYNTGNSQTWFVRNDKNSYVNGYGRIRSIQWPSNKSLYGPLKLYSFTALERLNVQNNKLNYLNITGASSLRTVNVNNNKITKVVISGSKNMTYFNAQNNPTTYVEYVFYGNKKAVVKAGGGGVARAGYVKSGNRNMHYLRAVVNKGYTFDGWYIGNKRVSKSLSYSLNKGQSFIITAKFKKNAPKHRVVVSISKQKLWYYKSGKLALTTNVVTGNRSNHATPTGKFQVRGKARNVYLVGRNYRSYVSYWMLIDYRTQIGIHDATWRSRFGGNIYKYNGSHGCINLPYAKAKYLYNNVPKGTLVEVIK